MFDVIALYNKFYCNQTNPVKSIILIEVPQDNMHDIDTLQKSGPTTPKIVKVGSSLFVWLGDYLQYTPYIVIYYVQKDFTVLTITANLLTSQ